MGISKLTCTLKGEVPPKSSLDEYALFSIDRGWRMCAKFSIISSLCRSRPCSSNRLIEYFSLLFVFFYHQGFLGHGRVIFLKRDKLETQLAILVPRRGHPLKNNQEQPTLILLIQIIFRTKWKNRYYNEILMKNYRNREIQQYLISINERIVKRM